MIKKNCGPPHNITINPPYNNEWNELQKKQPMDYTNTGLYRFIYGLYQYRIIPIMNEWKRVLYTIYQYLKRYHHFNTTTHDKKCNASLLTSSPTMHHITLPQDERTTANNIFIPERPQPIKCRTIYHRWNYTTIQNHFNITGHYITR